jgi:hypothetical protein
MCENDETVVVIMNSTQNICCILNFGNLERSFKKRLDIPHFLLMFPEYKYKLLFYIFMVIYKFSLQDISGLHKISKLAGQVYFHQHCHICQ